MTREALLKRISIDPNVCSGTPCIRGTRIWVALVVDNLADGVPESEILTAYPQLTHDDIHAALAYAAEMTREHALPQPTLAARPARSILELEGLGKEVWEGVDPKQYISEMRDEWDHP